MTSSSPSISSPILDWSTTLKNTSNEDLKSLLAFIRREQTKDLASTPPYQSTTSPLIPNTTPYFSAKAAWSYFHSLTTTTKKTCYTLDQLSPRTQKFNQSLYAYLNHERKGILFQPRHIPNKVLHDLCHLSPLSTSSSSSLSPLLSSSSSIVGESNLTPTKAFQKTFPQREYMQWFDDFDFQHCVIAGGAIGYELLHQAPEPHSPPSIFHTNWNNSDIDIFFYGLGRVEDDEDDDKVKLESEIKDGKSTLKHEHKLDDTNDDNDDEDDDEDDSHKKSSGIGLSILETKDVKYSSTSSSSSSSSPSTPAKTSTTTTTTSTSKQRQRRFKRPSLPSTLVRNSFRNQIHHFLLCFNISRFIVYPFSLQINHDIHIFHANFNLWKPIDATTITTVTTIIMPI